MPHCRGFAPPLTTTAPQMRHWARSGSLVQRSKCAQTALGFAMARRLRAWERTRCVTLAYRPDDEDDEEEDGGSGGGGSNAAVGGGGGVADAGGMLDSPR